VVLSEFLNLLQAIEWWTAAVMVVSFWTILWMHSKMQKMTSRRSDNYRDGMFKAQREVIDLDYRRIMAEMDAEQERDKAESAYRQVMLMQEQIMAMQKSPSPSKPPIHKGSKKVKKRDGAEWDF